MPCTWIDVSILTASSRPGMLGSEKESISPNVAQQWNASASSPAVSDSKASACPRLAGCHRLPCVPGIPRALGGLSTPGTCSSTGQAAERPEPVGSVGAGKEAPGCFGPQEDWGTLLECLAEKKPSPLTSTEGSPDPAPGPESAPPSSHFLGLGRGGGPWGSTWCV